MGSLREGGMDQRRRARRGAGGDPKRSGILATKETFLDFDLTFEYLIDEHGKYNSGFTFAVEKPRRNARSFLSTTSAWEGGEFVGLFLDRWLDKGDEEDRIRKPKKWNQVRLLVVGPKVTVWLNGERIVEYDPDAPDLLVSTVPSDLRSGGHAVGSSSGR